MNGGAITHPTVTSARPDAPSRAYVISHTLPGARSAPLSSHPPAPARGVATLPGGSGGSAHAEVELRGDEVRFLDAEVGQTVSSAFCTVHRFYTQKNTRKTSEWRG